MVMRANGGLHHPQNGSRTHGGTDASRRVESVEADASFCQRINVGRLDDLIPVTTEPAADIFKVDPENIRAFFRFGRWLRKHDPAEENNGLDKEGGESHISKTFVGISRGNVVFLGVGVSVTCNICGQ